MLLKLKILGGNAVAGGWTGGGTAAGSGDCAGCCAGSKTAGSCPPRPLRPPRATGWTASGAAGWFLASFPRLELWPVFMV